MPLPRIVGDLGRYDTVPYGYSTGTALALNSLMFASAGVAQGAGALADQGSVNANQRLFAKQFCGISNQAKLSTDPSVTDLQILRECFAEFDCPSQTFNVGDKLGISIASPPVAANATAVTAVADSALQIGTVCAEYTVATTRVRGFFFSRLTPNHLGGALNGIHVLSSGPLPFAAFTASTTTGKALFPTGLPANCLVLGWSATVTTGFIGDTSAVLEVGTAASAAAFSQTTSGSCFAAGVLSSAVPIATVNVAAAVTPQVTITTAAAFSSVSAGLVSVNLLYVPLN